MKSKSTFTAIALAAAIALAGCSSSSSAEADAAPPVTATPTIDATPLEVGSTIDPETPLVEGQKAIKLSDGSYVVAQGGSVLPDAVNADITASNAALVEALATPGDRASVDAASNAFVGVQKGVNAATGFSTVFVQSVYTNDPIAGVTGVLWCVSAPAALGCFESKQEAIDTAAAWVSTKDWFVVVVLG